MIMVKPDENIIRSQQTRIRYNRIASIYNLLEAIPTSFIDNWRKKLLKKAKGKILEVGVGTGKNFDFYPAGAVVTAIDFAEKMIALAKKNAEKKGLTFKIEEGDVENLAYPDNFFDTVVATFVFCSVPNPLQGLKELRRVVQPDGQALFLEHVRIDNLIIGWIMDRLNPLIVRLVGANINRQTVENIKAAGFLIEEIEHLGFMKMVKMVIAKPNKDNPGAGGLA